MSNPVFPLADQQDSKYYSISVEDPVMRTPLEGGYVASRPRHTRTPRKTWKTGFSYLNETDKETLSSFWNTVKGGSVIFDWQNPQDLVTYQVRFVNKPEFKYVGKGGNHRYDVALEVEQA